MMITRHNYEEYFILYMDNELDSEKRRQVEVFLQQHPDLKEEFELLSQFKLTPDTTLTYKNKEELLKENGITAINLSNYEEWFVLYIDNELTAGQQKMIEQFIVVNPSLLPALKLLQSSKLEPSSIVFENKDLLYRHEAKVRIIPMRMWRVAAAVLILAIGLTSVILLNNKPSLNNAAEVANFEGSTKKINTTEEPEAIYKDQQTNINNINGKENQLVNNEEKIPVTNDNQPSQHQHYTSTNINDVSNKKDAPVAAIIKNETNNLPKPLNNRNLVINQPDNIIADINIPKDIITPKNVLTNAPVTTKTPQPSNIVTASYNNDIAADFEPNDGKKNKLRGIFRKITRTLEKRTNIDATDDDDRLLVAGLSIKLK